MNTSTKEKGTKRNPFVALVLSIAATGLGHVYCGKLTKGLILFFISFAFAPIIVTGIQSMSSTFSLILVIFSVLILVGVFIYAVIDAFFIAKRMDSPFVLKEFNRWYIYLLFIVVSISYPTNLSSNIRSHIIQAFTIPSASMVPSILKGDYVLLNKFIYNTQSPQRGDVVVFVNPNDRHKNWIKRIVALPNDTIEIRNKVLFINDEPLAYRSISKTKLSIIQDQITGSVVEEINGTTNYQIMLSNNSGANFRKMKVPNGHCFVLGDNRGNCEDSRHLGPIPLRDVMGRVDFIYLPAETWSRFGVF
ncbi:MAG: signal peptidase I [Desulfobacula sp.]|uniref:signal peptidase I n=1 Tax=Desulfobacula sp. TaxID=2593537 RepID=UPI0025BF3F2D|nr:signal peptidase I [Desulfobacula sp.]MCD4722456.1 signal peptidase I [Desulfobacula sp.]